MMQNFRQAIKSDLPGIRSLLQECGLPIDDLDDTSLDHFLLFENESGIAGVVGMQVFENIALLRSLAVTRSCRGTGLGNALVVALEELASTIGVTDLWLLTTDASGFFLDRGFAHCDRKSAPNSIRSTPEFADLCPVDAYLMHRRLPN